MRHFEQVEIADRYAKYRPQVHGEIIDTVANELGWSERFKTAVDFACGTGHSSQPLLKYAEQVIGCDISEAMLEQARKAHPRIGFKHVEDNVLPFQDGTANLLTIGFAFHWLDQAAFLSEASRVLNKNGLLVIYNMSFPGVMRGNDSYHDWHHSVYTARFPTPKRNRKPLRDILEQADYKLVIDKVISLSMPQKMTAFELRNYLTTQSNISAAVKRGESLADIDAWLDKGIEPHFSKAIETFEYKGHAGVLRPT